MIVSGQQLEFSLGNRAMVSGVSLVAQPGRVTALTGPSGSGKSTLLHILGLLVRPTAGTVSIDGLDVSGWSDAQRRRFWATSAAFVLQDGGLVDEESVAYNVTMSKSLLRGRPNGDRNRIADVLTSVGLDGREDERAAGLSGGEKQRLAFARALYKNARVVYVDEPTASLDVGHRQQLGAMMHQLAERDCTVITATHDDTLIASADDVIDMTQVRLAHPQP